MSTTFESIRLSGFLSFAPEAPEIELRPLNVIIGPNGSGKSNLLEAFSLLKATHGDLAATIREGGGAAEWIWKGKSQGESAGLETAFRAPGIGPLLLYAIQFAPLKQRFEIQNERLENLQPSGPDQDDISFYYRWEKGRPMASVRSIQPVNENEDFSKSVVNRMAEQGIKNLGFSRTLVHTDIAPDLSILSQRRDPDSYPEITATASLFSRIQIFREWTFGRNAAARRPQAADLPADYLLPDLSNLGLVLNELQHKPGRWAELQQACARFLPRFKQLTTRVLANTVQIYLHEENLSTPIPATRLSDGTLRFLGLLAILLSAEDYPLICIEEPELGLHPDAVAFLAELLIHASTRSQLIITTHSEALISALGDSLESVLVCQHTPVTGTTLTRLKPEALAEWLKDYSLGEIWRMGEIGGNP